MKKRDARRERFLRDYLDLMFADRRFRQTVREVVLEVEMSQRRLHEQGMVRSWLDACRAAGCRPYLSEKRPCVILYRNPEALTVELRAAALAYREPILAYLQHLADSEHLTNGKAAP